jgi:hypothetical protein
MEIKKYYDYQKKCLNRKSQQNIIDDFGIIRFGVNIDIENWTEEMQELKTKMPKEFLFNSEADAMKYLDQTILGINTPQMYMKVEGTWTGGHEENLRLRTCNINHGK